MSLLYSVAAPGVKTWLHLTSDLQVFGKENVPKNGPLIMAVNHLNTADPPLLGVTLPRQIIFMAKDELFGFPGGLFVRTLGAFSARKFGKSGMALRQALRVLSNGEVLGIFPEGKRSADHQMNRGEIGVAFIALRSGAPVLPVGISGSEYLGIKKPFFRRPGITVTIGQPFSFAKSTGKLNRDQLMKTTDLIMHQIAQVLPPDYRGIYDEDGSGVEDGNQTGK